MRREEELRSQGWQRRGVATGGRLLEIKSLYEEIGLEVHLEPLAAVRDGYNGCTRCYDGHEEEYQVIYTRPRRG